MEFLQGKPASSSTTKNGTFWFCGQKPSCESFCPDQDCYMYMKALATFCKSGCLHPVCPAHQRYAKLRVVKKKMKQSYGRPFFVCSEGENLFKFWQCSDIFESPRPLCLHGMVYCERKVKKDGPNQIRLFYYCPTVDSCNFFAGKRQEPHVVNTGIVLFTNPPQYRYKTEETGETFNSTKTNAQEALEEHKFLKSVNG